MPYSENAVLTEYFDLLTQHDGTEWLQVLSILEDPEKREAIKGQLSLRVLLWLS